jgi:hypothetical protein
LLERESFNRELVARASEMRGKWIVGEDCWCATERKIQTKKEVKNLEEDVKRILAKEFERC